MVLGCLSSLRHVYQITKLTVQDEAADEAAKVAQWLENQGIHYVVEKIDWGADGPPTSNKNERAREKRYDLLRKVAIESNSNLVLTAHHADDQVCCFTPYLLFSPRS